MSNVITKHTMIPIGAAIAAMVYFINLSVGVSSRIVKLEAEVHNQKSTDQIHTQRLLQLSTSIQTLDATLIRQSAVLKSVEKSLHKIENKL